MENRDNGHMESMELARLQQEIRSLQGRISETSKNLEDAEIQRDTYRKEVFFLKNRIETLESNGEPQGRGEVNPGGQRVSILVDVHNMYTSAKSIHQAKLSYQRLIKTASGGRPLNRAIAYVIGRGGASQEDTQNLPSFTLERFTRGCRADCFIKNPPKPITAITSRILQAGKEALCLISGKATNSRRTISAFKPTLKNNGTWIKLP